MSTYFEISDRVLDYSDKALKRAEQSFAEIERIGEYNQQKVLSAFIKNKVSETDFNSTGGHLRL